MSVYGNITATNISPFCIYFSEGLTPAEQTAGYNGCQGNVAMRTFIVFCFVWCS